MIEALKYYNLDNDSIELNTDVYPVSLYDSQITSRYDKRSKAGDDGMWPTYPYEEGMEITIEGEILADDSDDYNTKRWALINIIRKKTLPRQQKSGRLLVLFSNAPVSAPGEAWLTDVALDSFSAPRNGGYPGLTAFRIVFYSFTPYYWDTDDSSIHYYDS